MNLSLVLATPTKKKPGRGRPKAVEDSKELLRRRAIVRQWEAGTESADEVGAAFGIHGQTIRRWARELAKD